MNSFNKGKLENYSISNGMGALLARTSKKEGAEGELERLEPAIVDTLRKSSIITSAVASCAIEGIDVPEAKLIALSDKMASPESRKEHEVLNYKVALDYIFQAPPASLQPSPDLLRRIHALSMAGSEGAGAFKRRDNKIIEKTEFGDRLRFTPTPAAETEQAISSLCLSYNEAISKETAAPQICLAAFVLDFTCIHPFADGNGRVSRLITTAALLELGVKMPTLISLEEIIQNRQEAYYLALQRSSQGWHTGSHDLSPFLRFHLETISQGYDDFHKKIERLRNG